jgi:Zn-dependent protease
VLRFPLPGVRVSIHFSFLLVAAFGLPVYRGWQIAAWTVAVFIAVLLHEAGHAFTARAFGADRVSIMLYAFGGVTTWSSTRTSRPGPGFVTSAAGSAVGIAAGLAVIGLGRMGMFRDLPDLALVFLESFVWAGLVWGILNWIPILPLDGGHMLQHALKAISPKRAPAIARVVSVIAGVVVVAVAWRYEQRFLAIFVAMITFMGLREGKTDRVPPEPESTSEQSSDTDPPAFPI